PATDSALASAWLKEIDLSAAPIILTTERDHTECPSNPDPTICHWACSNCALTDVVTCPEPNTWGLTFNDGPSTKATADLLDVLRENNLKATFFLGGGNVVANQDVVKRQAAEGHHLASLTWSQTSLTTLTNDEIVVEVRWTEKAIEEVTGQKVRYIRPPNGDVDNRVHFVLKTLGYTVVDWSGKDFDTKDLDVVTREKTVEQVISRFKETLTTYTNPTTPPTQDFITLAHDSYPETVAITKELISLGIQSGLKIQSVASCLQDNWPYASLPGVGIDGANSEGLPSRPSDVNTALPPSGHVDYNDYYTMEGQLLNKLIAQARGQGFSTGGGGHSSSGESLFDRENRRWLGTLFGSVIASVIMF
ncbi:chitin deacetylase, partial [Linnemannia schmuckeri]